MKKNLLLILFSLFFTTAIFAQNSQTEPQEDQIFAQLNSKKNISVFPNPADDYIGLSNSDDVKQLIVFNVVGRKMKSFMVSEGGKYEISELPTGMYLIQMLDFDNKVITTQRLNKK